MVKVGVRFLQSLLFLAVFTTFLANLLLILKSNGPCTKVNSGFPWHSSERVELLDKKQLDESRKDNVHTRPPPSDREITATSNDNDEIKILQIEVLSSKSNISVTVNGKKLLYGNHPNLVGINVVVVNQETGERMGTRAFDTYDLEQEAQLLQEFVEDVTVGRIICFTVRDEASDHLKKSVRAFLKHFGSVFINRLKWRDMWAFVIQKTKYSARVIGEAHQRCMTKDGQGCQSGYGEAWAPPVSLVVTFRAERSQDACEWEDTPSNRRRRKFCRRYEGYPGVCSCK
ncbi:protein O-linked-mannose beta-1,2-N-acetylglucosaminyltransferase 1-like [Exaiptasia diaphana]|uniref:ILEI/PANDER domain-containing protein n=1 Tax=Exaiptasia diaphana TaxID=2652724 RepID=A0A913Y1I7_EXADI|nr:protein O-linked-mannose beta-1,2-N-acetylglucosaminyltransferase 1-like [Exaiptasia diaphana]